MSEKSYLTGNCPKCGAELQIPAELQEFSCMYCGARLTRDALAAQPAETPQCDAAEAEAAWRAASGKLADCIRNYPGYNRKYYCKNIRCFLYERLEHKQWGYTWCFCFRV